MSVHVTARLAWHNDGWNGRVCCDPARNSYCVGCNSFPGQMIAERRDLAKEKDAAGKPIASLDFIPPCIYSANAFGPDPLTAFADPPEFFKDGTQQRRWPLPPSTVCQWPYEEMYADALRLPRGGYDNEQRRARANAYFDALERDQSLIFYYANYSNPLSEDESKRYLLVGVARLKEVGEELMFAGCSQQTRERYGGGFVWDRNLTSHYPEQGLRLPYHAYRDQPDKLKRFALIPENARTCKYGSRHLTDDDALGLVEQFLVAVEALREMGDNSEDWAARKAWLEGLVAELWSSRGLYPGLPGVLETVGFQTAIPWFKAETQAGREQSASDAIFALLESKSTAISGVKLTAAERDAVLRRWKLQGKPERQLLREVLPRFELRAEQIKAILDEKRSQHGIVASLSDIAENPYLLSEQYCGNDADDIIPWGRIDRGMIPSPDLGGDALAEKDDRRRMRALAVQCLGYQEQHVFLSAQLLLQEINKRLEILPEYKRHRFTAQYWEADADFLSESLHLRTEDDNLYVYLRGAWEDERLIEAKLRFLLGGPDIKLTRPVTEATWTGFLFDPGSPLASKAGADYRKAIEGQVKACQRVFIRPLTVLAGAAGTGKTTVIKAIIKAIKKGHGTGTSVIALAPTGKATDRVREILERDDLLKGTCETATIHSFLAKRGWLNPNMTFRSDGGEIEEGFTTIILDESSMLNLDLAACLFRAVRWQKVQRLILVGDPNQLPPIGRGRVFADIIDHLRASEPNSIATLHDNLRQLENRVCGRGTGILELAALYVRGEAGAEKNEEESLAAEAVLRRVQEGGDVDHDLRVIYWNDPEKLPGDLIACITRDLESLTGGQSDPEKPYEIWRKGFNNRPEAFQVLSPCRGELFGIEAINEAIQTYLAKRLIERVGVLDGITLFDKVIQVRNRPQSDMAYAWDAAGRKNVRLESFNGELGFVKPHGFDGNGWMWKDDFRLKHFQVVFSRKQQYWVNYGSELGKDERDKWIPKQAVEDNLELGYAISVHKAQGSEFDRTYVVVPKSKTTLLSPELFYTALTRASRHCTLLVEQDISSLLSMRRLEMSHLLRINSSLFDFRKVPQPLLDMGGWYEEGKIHEALAGCMVRSKSEVIIANLLTKAEIPFVYEIPLFAPDGTMYLPDFTVEWRGQKYFWEHLGMLEKPSYRQRWEDKRKWYDQHFPGMLIVTEESKHLSKVADKLIRERFV